MALPTQNEHAGSPHQIWLISTAVLLAALLVSSAILLTYKVVPPPDNARVIVDEQRLTYASTPCVLFNKLDRELIANRTDVSDPAKPLQLFPYAGERTIGEIRGTGNWKRDATCEYATGFDQIVTLWMRLTGYRSRWTDDGQWRW